MLLGVRLKKASPWETVARLSSKGWVLRICVIPTITLIQVRLIPARGQHRTIPGSIVPFLALHLLARTPHACIVVSKCIIYLPRPCAIIISSLCADSP